MQNILTTTQLLNLAFINKNKWIEASLLLSFNGKATHFIFAKNSSIFDEGIDGELVRWKEKEFIDNYKSSQWVIDQIV